MENSKNIVKVIGAVALGAAIGGALGILFAPAKGSETRKRISLKGEDVGDQIKQKLALLMDEVKKQNNAVKEKVAGLISPAAADTHRTN